MAVDLYWINKIVHRHNNGCYFGLVCQQFGDNFFGYFSLLVFFDCCKETRTEWVWYGLSYWLILWMILVYIEDEMLIFIIWYFCSFTFWFPEYSLVKFWSKANLYLVFYYCFKKCVLKIPSYPTTSSETTKYKNIFYVPEYVKLIFIWATWFVWG